MFESVKTLFEYILAQVDAKEGRKKEWSGYIQTEKEHDARFCMENEWDGENVIVAVEDHTWRHDDKKKYAVLVTKRFYIREGEEEHWIHPNTYPSSEQQVDTLVQYVCKLHGDIGLYTLFMNKGEKELQKLKEENADQKKSIEYLRSRLDKAENPGDYYAY